MGPRIEPGTRRQCWRLARAGATLLALAAHASASEPPRSSDAEASEVLHRFDERLQQTRSLRGRFVQTFTSSGLGIPQSEEGTFAISRPDLIRWEYYKPERKTAVSDGQHTWLHLPEQRVVYRGSVVEWREGGAFSVLAGGRLEESFVALEAKAEGVSRTGDVLLRLVPRAPREEYEELQFEFDPRSLMLHRITAVDGMGNRITMILDRVEVNPELPEGFFVFTPPPGTEVIDQSTRTGS